MQILEIFKRMRQNRPAYNKLEWYNFLRDEGASVWSARESIEDIDDGTSKIRRNRLPTDFPEKPKDREKKIRFIQSVLPQLQKLTTPADESFHTAYSPYKRVANIPVSGLILFGSVVRNESYGLSDIDVAVTIPVIPSPDGNVPFTEEFNHLKIGYFLRKDFKESWKRTHFGRIPPYKIDLMVFPDPKYVYPEYFLSRPVWNSIMSEGKTLYSQ